MKFVYGNYETQTVKRDSNAVFGALQSSWSGFIYVTSFLKRGFINELQAQL